MKKLACLGLFLACITHLLAQQPTKNRDYYLTKSKKQKTVAIVLLTGGGLATTLGFGIGGGNESSFDEANTGGIIAVVGIASMIGSIPLFIASARNKRKAKLVINTVSHFDPLAGINKKMITAGIAFSL
jgi:hypothetical protein